MRNYLSTVSKIILDYTLACIGIISLSPLLVYIVYRIKKEDNGPVLYKHTRIGLHGKPFTCYKFRSMVSNAQEILQKHLAEDVAARKEWDLFFKLKDDPRVTTFGKQLRQYSLDELPQLFNVLKGEMSLVGPRPVVQEELDKYYGENAKLYCMVKPGITGLWQVSGRNDLEYDERVALDFMYIMHRSIISDIVILWRTIGVVLKKKGAY